MNTEVKEQSQGSLLIFLRMSSTRTNCIIGANLNIYMKIYGTPTTKKSCAI